MKQQTNLHSIKLLSLAIFVAITIAAGATFSASAQDAVEYNQVYDCGSGKRKFKVLSCKGTDKFDKCDVFYINEHSPGGGFKDTINRNIVDDAINQGCEIKGRPAVRNQRDGEGASETPATKTDKNQVTNPTSNEANSSAACFASDPDSNGKTANEKTFRGVLRRFWEKKPEESGPTVTITFQQMIVSAPRRWRPTFDDAYAQADPNKPIYPVRATFTTCTDYADATTKRKMERIYDCFVHKTGGWQCMQTGASGPLATKDVKEYTPKKRQ